jgi:hypothetical protein
VLEVLKINDINCGFSVLEVNAVAFYFIVQVTDIQTNLQTSESAQLSDAALKLQITDDKCMSDVSEDLTSGDGCHHGFGLTHGIERFDKLESVPEDAKESEEESEVPTVGRKSSNSFTAAIRSESDLPLKDSQEPPETIPNESMEFYNISIYLFNNQHVLTLADEQMDNCTFQQHALGGDKRASVGTNMSAIKLTNYACSKFKQYLKLFRTFTFEKRTVFKVDQIDRMLKKLREVQGYKTMFKGR